MLTKILEDDILNIGVSWIVEFVSRPDLDIVIFLRYKVLGHNTSFLMHGSVHVNTEDVTISLLVLPLLNTDRTVFALDKFSGTDTMICILVFDTADSQSKTARIHENTGNTVSVFSVVIVAGCDADNTGDFLWISVHWFVVEC